MKGGSTKDITTVSVSQASQLLDFFSISTDTNTTAPHVYDYKEGEVKSNQMLLVTYTWLTDVIG